MSKFDPIFTAFDEAVRQGGQPGPEGSGLFNLFGYLLTQQGIPRPTFPASGPDPGTPPEPAPAKPSEELPTYETMHDPRAWDRPDHSNEQNNEKGG